MAQITHRPAHISLLLDMLAYKRPAGSKSERKFINRYLRPLGVQTDKAGNVWKRIGNAPVLWSSHTDTVHREAGRQPVVVSKGIASTYGSNCLGADCTVGVWLMVEMIKAEVPGLYIFHRAEEIGGLGSDYIAKHNPKLLDGIKFAIAFDRYGTTSIITHQGFRCCSDDFARSLKAQLGPEWKLDDGGTFTDTANYTDLVPECTNISVGYHRQHHSTETQDLDHAEHLLGLLLSLDVNRLSCVRQPGTYDDYGKGWNRYYYSAASYDDVDPRGRDYGYGRYDTYSDFEDEVNQNAPRYAELWGDDGVTTYTPKAKAGGKGSGGRSNYELLLEACRDNPEAVADILDSFGITPEDIFSHMHN